MGFLLWLIALCLYPFFTVINFFVVKNKKGYFKKSALSLDIYGNVEFKTSLNKFLIRDSYNNFGEEGETMSSVLGKNKLSNNLTNFGKFVCNILDLIDKNHCVKSINNNF